MLITNNCMRCVTTRCLFPGWCLLNIQWIFAASFYRHFSHKFWVKANFIWIMVMENEIPQCIRLHTKLEMDYMYPARINVRGEEATDQSLEEGELSMLGWQSTIRKSFDSVLFAFDKHQRDTRYLSETATKTSITCSYNVTAVSRHPMDNAVICVCTTVRTW